MNSSISLNCHKLIGFTPWTIPRLVCQDDYIGEIFPEEDYNAGGYYGVDEYEFAS